MRSGWLRHQHRSHQLWHYTFYAAAVVVVFWVLKALAPVLAPIVAAMGMAYLLDPLVNRLTRRGMRRSVAVGVIILGFLLVVALAVSVIVPLMADDMRRFADKIPDLFDRVATWLHKSLRLDVPRTWREAVATYGDRLRQYAADSGGPLLRGFVDAIGSILGFVLHLFELLLVPVFAFYFLVDWPHIVSAITKLVPPRHRDEVFAIAAEIDSKISHWVRGQLIVSSVLAVLYAVTLSVIGIQLAVPIGILTGVLTFIPYVGTAVGLGLSLSMVLLDWSGPTPLVSVLGAFAVLHMLESWVLVPKLVGKKVGLGEAGALFGVLAGAQLLGFMGVLLAIPMAASGAVLLRRVVKYYERTEFFTYGDPIAAAAGSIEAAPSQPPPSQPKVEESR